jgi:hypothetical protein
MQLRSGSGRSLFQAGVESVDSGAQVESMSVVEGVLIAVFPPGANDPNLQFGAIVSEDAAGSTSFPWIGYMSITVLLLGLFLTRKHAFGAVFSINVVRASVAASITGLAVIDKPGKLTLTVGGLFMVSLQFTLLFPLHEVIDLPIWDEAGNMGGGIEFLYGNGLGDLTDSPLPKLIYAGLVWFWGPAGSIFANHYLVKIALVLFIFSARVAGSVLVSLVLSGIWAISFS